MDVGGALAAFTVTDGMVAGAWCGWLAVEARGLANGFRARGRGGDEVLARWAAAGLMGLGAGVFYVGWSMNPEGGPTAWSGIAALAWGLGWASARRMKRTGRPLL